MLSKVAKRGNNKCVGCTFLSNKNNVQLNEVASEVVYNVGQVILKQ